MNTCLVNRLNSNTITKIENNYQPTSFRIGVCTILIEIFENIVTFPYFSIRKLTHDGHTIIYNRKFL